MRRLVALLVVIAVVVFVVACNGGDGDESAADPGSPTADVAEDPSEDPPVEAAGAGAVRLTRVGRFNQPTYVTAPPGDKTRLFVVEQEGVIRVLVNRKLRSSPFLDIAGDVGC